MRRNGIIRILTAPALLLGLAIVVAGTLTPSDAFAAASCDGSETVVVSCADNVNGIWSILLLVLNIMTAGVGILGVAGIVRASILWTTAEDKADQVNKAKGMITNTVIGLLAYVLLFSGLQFLIPGGVFERDFAFASVTNSIDEFDDRTPGAPVEDGGFGGFGGGTGGSGGSGGGSGGGTSDDGGGTADTKIASLKNLRDASASNSTLKSGVLFRSATLAELTPDDAKKLSTKLGAGATIIDLRPPNGPNAGPDKSVPDTKHFVIGIESILDTEPMVSDPVRGAQLSRASKTAANAKGSVLIHCFAGKDRTGWMVAMIMYAAGTDDTQVMTEYLKSNGKGVGVVKKEWLTHGLQAARSKHGSIVKYLKSIGLSDADLSKLKSKFGA